MSVPVERRVLEFIDYLEGSPQTFAQIERFVFDGDRVDLLRSMIKLRRDRAISIKRDGRDVEAWQLEQWRRSPSDPTTTAALADVLFALA